MRLSCFSRMYAICCEVASRHGAARRARDQDGQKRGSASGSISILAATIAVMTTVFSSAGVARAQASAAGVRAGDLQVGGSYTFGKPDYGQDNLRGYGFYSSFDFRPHFGVEIDFHQANTPNPNTTYERSYEVGGRYVRQYNIFNPYLRVSYGRGVFNYPYNVANLAYNMGVLAGGVDVNVHRHINVRAEYEYQHWFSFRGSLNPDTSGTLTPQLVNIGVAYHFE